MRQIALLLMFCSYALCQAAPEPLRFSVMESWAMPMASIDNGQLTGGIMRDLMLELAERVGREAEFLVMPRMRVLLAQQNREFDVRCYVARSWVPDADDGYAWSPPYMEQRDLLVARQDTPMELKPSDSRAQLIGTVLGYSYPKLQAYFDQGSLLRDDARSQDLVLQKLLARRYDLAVSSDLALAWFNLQHESDDRLVAIDVLERTPLSCMVRKAADIPTERILQALEEMKASGEIERIVARYR